MQDSTYYGNYLKDLYEGSDKDSKPLYNLNPVLFSFSKNDSGFFDSCIAPLTFNKNINNAFFGVQSDAKVEQYAVQANTSENIANVATSLASNVKDFSDSVNNLGVNIDFKYSGSLDGSTIGLKLKDLLPKPTNDIDLVNAQKTLTKIVRTVCQFVTNTYAIPSLYQSTKTPPVSYDSNTTRSPSFESAMKILSSLDTENKNKIHELLSEKLEGILAQIEYLDDMTIIFKNFNPGSSNGFKSPFYFLLRTLLIKQFEIPSGLLPFNISNTDGIYLKKALIESYLKTSYPFVQFSIINAMTKKNAAKGDYVNTRLGFLAKLVFVYQFIKNVEKTGMSNDASQSIYGFIIKIFKQLEDSVKIPEIARGLHLMSEQAVNTTRTLEEVKKEIASSQISLGNIVNNVEGVESQYHGKVVEFWIVFGFICLYAIVATVLIIMKMPTFVYFLIAIVIAIILVVMAIKVIKSMISKN